MTALLASGAIVIIVVPDESHRVVHRTTGNGRKYSRRPRAQTIGGTRRCRYDNSNGDRAAATCRRTSLKCKFRVSYFAPRFVRASCRESADDDAERGGKTGIFSSAEKSTPRRVLDESRGILSQLRAVAHVVLAITIIQHAYFPRLRQLRRSQCTPSVFFFFFIYLGTCCSCNARKLYIYT